jgi:hypothetical protein
VEQIKTIYAHAKNDGVRIITEEDRAQQETTGLFWGMFPTTFTSSIGQNSKRWRSGVSLATGNEEVYRHMRYRASSVVAGTKLKL